MCRAGGQEKQAGTHGHREGQAAAHRWDFFFKEAPVPLFRSFDWLKLAHPDYL